MPTPKSLATISHAMVQIDADRQGHYYTYQQQVASVGRIYSKIDAFSGILNFISFSFIVRLTYELPVVYIVEESQECLVKAKD